MEIQGVLGLGAEFYKIGVLKNGFKGDFPSNRRFQIFEIFPRNKDRVQSSIKDF